MAHRAIFGVTLSGKSTLAREFARVDHKAGKFVIVYDPVMSELWDCDVLTDDEEALFESIGEAIEEGKRIALFIDEADTLLGMGQRYNWWILTRGRHYQIETTIITQYPKLVAPTPRMQCAGDIYCFNLARDPARDLAEAFNYPGLEAAPDLLQGEFLKAGIKDKRRVVDRYKIF